MGGSRKKNREIREALKKAGMYQYELAELMGVSEPKLSVWMRKEMTSEQKSDCLEAIRKAVEYDAKYSG